MEPATVQDLHELIRFAFFAGLGKHPNQATKEDMEKWRDFTPCPRSTFQRVEHAVRMQEERSKGNG